MQSCSQNFLEAIVSNAQQCSAMLDTEIFRIIDQNLTSPSLRFYYVSLLLKVPLCTRSFSHCLCVWPLSPQNEHLNKCYYELTIAHKLSSGVTTPMGGGSSKLCTIKITTFKLFYGEAYNCS